MPRVRVAAAALLLLGLAGAAHAQLVTCPSAPPNTGWIGSGYGTYYFDNTIEITTSGLKPTPMDYNNGLCIDSADSARRHAGQGYPGGGIHTYSGVVSFVFITFKIDPSLGSFLSDPDKAFQAPGQDFCWPSALFDNNHTLRVCLTAMGHNRTYPYFLYVVDPNGKTKKIEPGIHNH